MNILLVYPKYPETFWSFKHVLKFVSKKAAFPPLGLLTVASLLPADWEKKLVDVNVAELQDEQIAWADIVLISAMLVQADSAQEIINWCKSHGKTVIVGGPAATTQHERFTGVDHFVLNEAEVTLPLFLADLAEGNAKPIYSCTDRPDIKQTPLPLWSLINMSDYVTMPVQYSRGCPFNCEFCDIIVLYGQTPRTKSPEQLVLEMQSLYDMGWRNDVFIVDDNFIGNKTNVKKMLTSLITWQKEHNYPFTFTTETSVNLADDKELMQMMSSANFHKVFVGIETPNINSLHECGKYQNASRDLEVAVKTIQQNGMQVTGGFIVGFDSDTDGIYDAQIRFIQKVGIVTAMVGLLNALPQTRLWHRLQAEGRLLGDSTGENTDASINFIPKIAREKLLAGYQKILGTLYSPKHYYARINTFISNYHPSVKARISLQDLTAGAKSLWYIGILSKARFLYWKLIVRTCLKKAKALPIAIELAIYGLHFEKVTEKILTA
jgi:radical SAM superfamily enzyme YgiQ (UPF0313 family)